MATTCWASQTFPEGEWCGLDMVPDGPITLEGEYYEVTFVLTIPVSVIAVEGLLSISERDEDRRFVLEPAKGRRLHSGCTPTPAPISSSMSRSAWMPPCAKVSSRRSSQARHCLKTSTKTV